VAVHKDRKKGVIEVGMEAEKNTGKSISFLLGAGFSVPMGYPMGDSLGEMIINKVNSIVEKYDSNPNPEYLYDGFPHILQKMIQYYKSSHDEHFDYEDFFEQIILYCKDKKKGEEINRYRLIQQIPIDRMGLNYQDTYQKFVCNLLRDADGIQFYHEQNKHLSDYKNFLTELESLLVRGYEINIHTLNHDLVFESFKNSSIGNEICDGFELKNTPYKGKNGKEWIELPYYNGTYDKKIRLYKLHGSIDQYAYYKENEDFKYDNHIKVYEDTSNWEFRKNDETFHFPELHPDFLTGKDSKEPNYNKPLYNKLIPRFEENLRNSKCLIIIGYGGKDDGINKRIINNLHSPCFVYDVELKSELEKVIEKVDTAKNFQNKGVQDFELPTTINF